MLNNNNSKKEYIDIPLTVEQTPLHLYQRFSQYKFPTEPIEIGFDFISRLDEAIRSNDSKNQLLSLYLNYFEPINSQKFTEKDWPACFQIESHHEDRDFNAKVQTLYNELKLRNQFEKIKNYQNPKFLQIAEQAWETYESILQRQSRQVNLPSIIAWEILENFLYELQRYYQIISNWPDKSKIQEQVFNIKRSKKLLSNAISLLEKQDIKSTPNKQNFGFFSIIALATIEVYEGNYQKALDVISRISLSDLSVYSRSIGALLTLFLTAAYAYFMLEQYKQSARLAELFLVFYQKNKKYFSGVIGQRIVTRQFEKLAGLLCLDYIFLQEKPKNIITQIFKSTILKLKEKQHRQKISDKYTKLRQNDLNTFVKLFQYCSLPSINSNPDSILDLVTNRFKALQTITLHTILQHYTQISVQKVAKLLKINPTQVKTRIQSFNNISTRNANWDRSIMQPLLSQTRKIHIEIQDQIIKLDTDETNAHEGFNEWQQYKKQIEWLSEKVNSL